MKNYLSYQQQHMIRLRHSITITLQGYFSNENLVCFILSKQKNATEKQNKERLSQLCFLCGTQVLILFLVLITRPTPTPKTFQQNSENVLKTMLKHLPLQIFRRSFFRQIFLKTSVIVLLKIQPELDASRIPQILCCTCILTKYSHKFGLHTGIYLFLICYFSAF